MKASKITSVLILLSLFTKANPILLSKPIDQSIIIEAVLDNSIKVRPYIIVYEKGYYALKLNVKPRIKIWPKPQKGNTYIFNLGNRQTGYFSLFLPGDAVDVSPLNEYHFEPGDHVRVTIKPTNFKKKFDLIFSGRGSGKYRCQSEFRNAVKLLDTIKVSEFDKNKNYHSPNHITRATEIRMGVTNKYQPEMSSYSYNLLNADIVGELGFKLFVDLNNNLRSLINKKDTIGYQNLAKDYKEHFSYNYIKDLPDNVLSDSKEYPRFMVQQIIGNYLIQFGKVDYKGYYDQIKNIKNPILRDRMIGIYFDQYIVKIKQDFNIMLQDALNIVQNKEVLAVLQSYMHQGAGEKAFNFTLTDEKGTNISLSDFKGKIVFIDFWFTGCYFCELYFKEILKGVEESYQGNPDIVFLTVSIDKNKDTWLKSVESGDYTSKRAINLFTNGEGLDNELIKYYNIHTYPRLMLIGGDSRIIEFTGDRFRVKDNLVTALQNALTNLKK